mmetsp:Transcript_12163/g.38582  ORF Transcript_12163/g.38582 Transcript_12163/m.38582 type:complete len:121 (+) Transcript_12163:39-401(+)
MSAPRRWGHEDEDDSTAYLDNTSLLASQRDEMSAQDDTLDLLGASVARQRELAVRIGDTVDDQGRLIDSVTDQVDRVGPKLRNTTRRVERVTADANTKCLWYTICLLFIILILVVVMAIQ